MSDVRLCIVFWHLLVISIHYGQSCGPAEIGQQYTIISTFNNPSDDRTVRWEIDNRYSTVVYDSSRQYESDLRDQNPNVFPNFYNGTRTQLTILNVTRNDGTVNFKHNVDGFTVYNCSLPVYKRASSPTCDTVILTGNQIRTKCTTAEVFPQAKCQFTLQGTGSERKEIADGTSYITYNHTDPEQGRNEYYSTSCTLKYPVNWLKPGNWTVYVQMYPDQTGVSLAQGTIGQAANSLQLSVPIVEINPENCPKGLAGEGDTNVRNGYIRKGERASCECTRAHAGNPPGTIGWSSTQGDNFVYSSQSDDKATIQLNSTDGPSSAMVAFQSPGPIYLCPNQQTNLNITCDVPVNSFNPAPLFTIRHGNSSNVVIKVPGDTAMSKSVNYNFTRSGQHTFTCRAENAIFNDIFAEASVKAIQVYAPPKSPPSFEVTGQSVITDNSGTWKKQGSDISVSCSAGEAYPLVSSVSVTCGQEMTSSNGHLPVSGVSGDELRCQCVVDHATKTPCNGLNLNSEMTIQTAYGPNDVIMGVADNRPIELPNKPLNLCSSEGLDLTVFCAVKLSEVRPGMLIKDFTLTTPHGFSTKQNYLLRLNESDVYKFVTKLIVTTGGSHSLVCEARNPKFSDIKQTQSVTIEVREPPKHPPKVTARSGSSQHGNVLMEGDHVTVTCHVSGGYPSVQSVTLTCGQDKSSTSNGTTTQLTLNEIGLIYKQAKCTCQATHVTGCYNLMGVLPLTVLPSNFTKAKVNEEDEILHTTIALVGAVIGSVIGTLVLVAAIALIVFFIRRGKAKRQKSDRDKEYDTTEKPPSQRYQNVRPCDPNYLTMPYSNQAHGPRGENTKQKTERVYQNQAFGDDTGTIEPDTDVYSYIKDE